MESEQAVYLAEPPRVLAAAELALRIADREQPVAVRAAHFHAQCLAALAEHGFHRIAPQFDDASRHSPALPVPGCATNLGMTPQKFASLAAFNFSQPFSDSIGSVNWS